MGIDLPPLPPKWAPGTPESAAAAEAALDWLAGAAPPGAHRFGPAGQCARCGVPFLDAPAGPCGPLP